MKKSLIFVGMLSIGFAYAQEGTDYSGRVGINTDTPSATLNVKTKTDATSPKNLELENQEGKKLVTVLNNGNIGIGTENPEVELSVIGAGNFTKGINSEGTVGASWLMLHSYGKGLLTNNIRWRNGAYRFVKGTPDDTKEGGWLFHNNFDKNTPFLLSVASNDPTQEDDVANLMTILTVNRDGNLGVNTFDATEKLQVEGKIKASSLAQSGAGDRIVYADENGVLKTGVSAAANVKLATANNVECTEANTGTMNFGSVTINGKATEAFGFCMKNSTGEYKWYYIYGGAGITTGSGAFGSGL